MYEVPVRGGPVQEATSSTMWWTAVWIAAPVALAACSGWPLYSDLPQVDTGAVPAPDDPRALIQPDWEPVEESPANDDPTALPFFALAPDDALLVDGVLVGIGWSDGAEPEVFFDEGCDSEGPRSPEEPGDWIADVDYALVHPNEEGLLCAEVEIGPDDVGWDLLLVEVDACGVPLGFAGDGDAPLGFGLGGSSGGWGWQVEAESRWAVLLAGYYPNEPDEQVAYRLGISLLPAESGGLCPLLPAGDR